MPPRQGSVVASRMAIPAWSWPPSGATARGTALVPFVTGMAVPDWTRPVLWPFTAGTFGPAVPTGSGNYGFGSAAADASSGVYATTWDGTIRHITSGGTVTFGILPSGQVYVGTAFAGGSGFALAATGTVYGSGGALLGTFPLPARPLVASGSTLMALMPSSGVGLMSGSTGATGFIARPAGMTTMSCIAVASGFSLAVAGYSVAASLSGVAAAALDPQNNRVMLAVGSGKALQWGAPGPYADAWTQTQSVTGLANLTTLCWRPDGTQALACSPVSGVVQALAYTAGVVSLAQTLTVSGACSVAVAGNSTDALVAMSGQSQAMPLTYAGATWATGTAVTGLTGITAVAPYGASGAVVAMSGAVRTYTLVPPGQWLFNASAAIGFVPTVVATDQFGQVYVAGSGAVALVSGSAVVASGTWAGAAPTAIAVQQGRIVLAVPSDSLLRVFGYSASGVLSQQFSGTLSLGTPVGLGLSYTTLFAMGSGSTPMYGFSGSPYTLTQPLSGSIGFWNGSAWATGAMGVGHIPSAIGLDASGGAWATTIQNTLWHFTSGAVLSSSGIVTQYSGQAQTAPISPSAVLVNSSGVYVATSIPGVLVQVA